MMMTATHHSNYIFTVQNYHTLNIIIKKEKQHARYSSSLIHEPGLRNFLRISQLSGSNSEASAVVSEVELVLLD